MGRLLAVSDLHVGHAANRAAVEGLRPRPDDLLIVAGDVGDTFAQVTWALATLKSRFAGVVWAPGNHDLWCLPDDPCQARGEQRYDTLVSWCRDFGVVTPEDDPVQWEADAGDVTVVPLFTLYDYSFRPIHLSITRALEVAKSLGVQCADELLLQPDPYNSRQDWCEARVLHSVARLDALPSGIATVLASHFPLRRELAAVPSLPLFGMWCGTTLTADWHRRYGASAVVSGHLHRPGTTWIDGVPFTDVSVGYPRERPQRPPRLCVLAPGAEPHFEPMA